MFITHKVTELGVIICPSFLTAVLIYDKVSFGLSMKIRWKKPFYGLKFSSLGHKSTDFKKISEKWILINYFYFSYRPKVRLADFWSLFSGDYYGVNGSSPAKMTKNQLIWLSGFIKNRSSWSISVFHWFSQSWYSYVLVNWTLGHKKDYFVCFWQVNKGYFVIY